MVAIHGGGFDLGTAQEYEYENIHYALRLLQAGVTVKLHSHPGIFHGSTELAASAEGSVRAQREIIDATRRGLRVPPPAS